MGHGRNFALALISSLNWQQRVSFSVGERVGVAFFGALGAGMASWKIYTIFHMSLRYG